MIFFNLKKNSNFLPFFDQAVVSGTSFFLSIFILRLLGLELFGIYSSFWLIILFINSMQLSAITNPMLTNVNHYSENEHNFYYSSIFIHQLIFNIAIFFLIKIIFFLGLYINLYENLPETLNHFIFALISIQFFQFFRKFLYSKKKFKKILVSDLIIFLTLFTTLIYLEINSKLELKSIFISLSIAYTLGSLINLFSFVKKLKFSLSKFLIYTKDNFKIAKWMVLSSITQWFSGNLWVVNTGLILGLSQLGILRACQQIVQIINLLFQTFENIVPVEITKIYLQNVSNINKYIKNFLIKKIIIIIFVVLFLSIFSKFILEIFYGSNISKYNYILIFLSFNIFLVFLRIPYSSALRTLGSTKGIFLSSLTTSIFALLVSKYIISKFQIYGVLFGLFFTEFILTTIIVLSYYIFIKKKSEI
tara:strand:- start:1094 stop:2350 length:1257 start_codon:yes stop_codon:yes gene_type:complete